MEKNIFKKGLQGCTFVCLPFLVVIFFSKGENISTSLVTSQVFLAESIPQEEVTPEMIAEYNRLAKYYNSQGDHYEEANPNDFERMKYIYQLLSAEQKKKVEKFPAPSIPPQPTNPSEPPIPAIPADYFDLLASKGASFIYEGNPITLSRAKELVKGQVENFQIQVVKTNSEVLISDVDK